VGDLGREERGTFAENAGSRQAPKEQPPLVSQKYYTFLEIDNRNSGEILPNNMVITEDGSKILASGSVRFDRNERMLKVGDFSIVATNGRYGVSTGGQLLTGCTMVIIQAFNKGKPIAYTAAHISSPSAIDAIKNRSADTPNHPINRAMDMLKQVSHQENGVEYRAMVIGGNVQVIKGGLEQIWRISVPENCCYEGWGGISAISIFYNGHSACSLEYMKQDVWQSGLARGYVACDTNNLSWPTVPAATAEGEKTEPSPLALTGSMESLKTAVDKFFEDGYWIDFENPSDEDSFNLKDEELVKIKYRKWDGIWVTIHNRDKNKFVNDASSGHMQIGPFNDGILSMQSVEPYLPKGVGKVFIAAAFMILYGGDRPNPGFKVITNEYLSKSLLRLPSVFKIESHRLPTASGKDAYDVRGVVPELDDETIVKWKRMNDANRPNVTAPTAPDTKAQPDKIDRDAAGPTGRFATRKPEDERVPQNRTSAGTTDIISLDRVADEIDDSELRAIGVADMYKSLNLGPDDTMLCVGPGPVAEYPVYAAIAGARVDICQPKYYTGFDQHDLMNDATARYKEQLIEKYGIDYIADRIDNDSYINIAQDADLPDKRYSYVQLIGVVDDPYNKNKIGLLKAVFASLKDNANILIATHSESIDQWIEFIRALAQTQGYSSEVIRSYVVDGEEVFHIKIIRKAQGEHRNDSKNVTSAAADKKSIDRSPQTIDKTVSQVAGPESEERGTLDVGANGDVSKWDASENVAPDAQSQTPAMPEGDGVSQNKLYAETTLADLFALELPRLTEQYYVAGAKHFKLGESNLLYSISAALRYWFRERAGVEIRNLALKNKLNKISDGRIYIKGPDGSEIFLAEKTAKGFKWLLKDEGEIRQLLNILLPATVAPDTKMPPNHSPLRSRSEASKPENDSVLPRGLSSESVYVTIDGTKMEVGEAGKILREKYIGQRDRFIARLLEDGTIAIGTFSETKGGGHIAIENPKWDDRHALRGLLSSGSIYFIPFDIEMRSEKDDALDMASYIKDLILTARAFIACGYSSSILIEEEMRDLLGQILATGGPIPASLGELAALKTPEEISSSPQSVAGKPEDDRVSQKRTSAETLPGDTLQQPVPDMKQQTDRIDITVGNIEAIKPSQPIIPPNIPLVAEPYTTFAKAGLPDELTSLAARTQQLSNNDVIVEGGVSNIIDSIDKIFRDIHVRSDAAVLLSENLFIEGGDRTELELKIKIALKRLLDSGAIAILSPEEIRTRIKRNPSKDKLAVVLSRADYESNRIWKTEAEKELTKANVLIIDDKLTGANYLYLQGVIGLARAIMANKKWAISYYYRMLSGSAISEDTLGLIKDGEYWNNIAFAVKAILKFKNPGRMDPDELRTNIIRMETLLIAA
jgi:hypothetical protein